jgi:hypothetical protein
MTILEINVQETENACGLNGCKDTHHRLLHGTEKKRRSPTEGRQEEERGERIAERDKITEGDEESRKANTHETFQEDQTKRIALRTIPIVLKNGDKRILVNCFLDEGSDTTYVNEDVVE